MSRGHRRNRPRTLTPEEAALWEKVTKEVSQLEKSPAKQASPAHPGSGGASRSNSPGLSRPRWSGTTPPALFQGKNAPRAGISASAFLAGQTQPGQNTTSVFAAGDPRAERHVRRGRREIDGVLDLHGLTQIAAHERLKAYVSMARSQKARCLLIITGKGGDPLYRARQSLAERFDRSPDRAAPRGVLRQRFLDWVEAPPLRDQIARVAKAKPADGGEGAFYVFLKAK